MWRESRADGVILPANLLTRGHRGRTSLRIRLFLEEAVRAAKGTKVSVPRESCSQLVRINN